MKFIIQLLFFIIFCSSLVLSQTDSLNVEQNPSQHKYEVMAFGGGSLPYLPVFFKDNWKSAWSVGIGYGISYTPGDLGYVTLYQTIDHSQLKYKQAVSNDQNLFNHGNIYITNIMVNLKGNFTLKIIPVEPYFFLGIGAMDYISSGINVEDHGNTVIKDRQKLIFAWTFGVGLEVPITKRIGVFVEGKSNIGVIEPTKQIFPLHGGVHLRF